MKKTACLLILMLGLVLAITVPTAARESKPSKPAGAGSQTTTPSPQSVQAEDISTVIGDITKIDGTIIYVNTSPFLVNTSPVGGTSFLSMLNARLSLSAFKVGDPVTIKYYFKPDAETGDLPFLLEVKKRGPR